MNTLTLKSDMDIYFHMSNHYKRIRKAKSCIDCKSIKGYDRGKKKDNRSARSLTPKSVVSDGYRSTQKLHIPNHSAGLRKHDCLHDNPAALRSASVPPPTAPRPRMNYTLTPSPMSTGRNSSTHTLKSTSKPKKAKVKRNSTRNSSRSRSNSSSQKTYEPVSPDEQDDQIHLQSAAPPPASPTPPKTTTEQPVATDVTYASSIEEHEYLHFLLRIFEDIIRNDIYTDVEMQRVFASHIEANRGRLSLTKMQKHVEYLTEELNKPSRQALYPLKDSARLQLIPPNSSPKEEIGKMAISCECGQIHEDMVAFRQCICERLELSTTQIEIMKNSEEYGRISLDRITECTEPPSQDALNLTEKSGPGMCCCATGCCKNGICNAYPFKEIEKDSIESTPMNSPPKTPKTSRNNSPVSSRRTSLQRESSKEGSVVESVAKSSAPSSPKSLSSKRSSKNSSKKSQPSSKTLSRQSSEKTACLSSDSLQDNDIECCCPEQSPEGLCNCSLRREKTFDLLPGYSESKKENAEIEEEQSTIVSLGVSSQLQSLHLTNSKEDSRTQTVASQPGVPTKNAVLAANGSPTPKSRVYAIKIALHDRSDADDDDYVLVDGPIYIPRALLRPHPPDARPPTVDRTTSMTSVSPPSTPSHNVQSPSNHSNSCLRCDSVVPNLLYANEDYRTVPSQFYIEAETQTPDGPSLDLYATTPIAYPHPHHPQPPRTRAAAPESYNCVPASILEAARDGPLRPPIGRPIAKFEGFNAQSPDVNLTALYAETCYDSGLDIGKIRGKSGSLNDTLMDDSLRMLNYEVNERINGRNLFNNQFPDSGPADQFEQIRPDSRNVYRKPSLFDDHLFMDVNMSDDDLDQSDDNSDGKDRKKGCFSIRKRTRKRKYESINRK